MLTIGISGGSGSGKTTVVKKIIEALPENSVGVMPQDAYYYDNGHLTKEEKLKIKRLEKYAPPKTSTAHIIYLAVPKNRNVQVNPLFPKPKAGKRKTYPNLSY